VSVIRHLKRQLQLDSGIRGASALLLEAKVRTRCSTTSGHWPYGVTVTMAMAICSNLAASALKGSIRVRLSQCCVVALVHSARQLHHVMVLYTASAVTRHLHITKLQLSQACL